MVVETLKVLLHADTSDRETEPSSCGIRQNLTIEKEERTVAGCRKTMAEGGRSVMLGEGSKDGLNIKL